MALAVVSSGGNILSAAIGTVLAVGAGVAPTQNYLGVNINILSNYNTEQPFLNIFKSASSNNSNLTAWNVSGGTTYPQLLAVLDANGYATTLPGGNSINCYMNKSLNDQDSSGYANGLPPGATYLYPAGPSGGYTLQFNGAGTIILGGNVTSGSLAVVSPASGVTASGLTITSTIAVGATAVVTFSVPAPSTAGIELTVSALPSGPSNYLNTMAVVRSSQLATYNAGTIFDPNFIASITNNGAGGYSRLRYMGAMNMTAQLYTLQLPALTTGSSTTQTMTSAFTGQPGTYPVVLGNGTVNDSPQTNTATFTYNSTTVVFGSAFTESVSAGDTNLWVPIFSGWSTRNQPGYAFWAAANGNGTPNMLPYETAIAMANACDTDCWLNIPIWANSYTGQTAFWTSLANLVKSNLNSGLKCYVELANEVFIESDYEYARLLANGLFGGTGGNWDQWMGAQIAQISDAFYTVFGASYASTIVCGFSTIFSSTGNGSAFLINAMNAPLWVAQGNQAPWKHHINAWYMAPYFPGSGLSAANATTMLGVTAPLDDYFACMYGNTGTSGNGSQNYSASVNALGFIGGTKAAVQSIISQISSQPWANLPLHGYEGGASFPANGYSGSYTGPFGGGAYTTLQNAMSAFYGMAHRDQRMQWCMYDPGQNLSSNPGYLPAMISAGYTSINHFDSCQSMSQFGPWGALENVMQLPSSGGSGTSASYPTYAGNMAWIAA